VVRKETVEAYFKVIFLHTEQNRERPQAW